ncbi:MAG: hypothetical protein Q4C87_10620 [Actinomycetaceae bacterium]|nr:hypothetical protein [Actinomycetaceae bacterium]
MANSFLDAVLKQMDQTPTYVMDNAQWEEVGTETRICPDCGAPRSEAHDAAECRYCGHVFMSALASEYARRDPHAEG